jgi:CheY-like chemotaxis protein
MLSVSDTGVGMDEVLRDRVFEAFFSTKGERGTGLGLATVQSIVSSYGGDIHVYSEKGCGTIFKVYFPLLREQDGSLTDLSVNDDIAVQENIIKGGRGTILLVEDNAQVRQLAESVLVSRGHKVLSCDGPVQALRQMDENKDIHLLLTDVIMPGMTGRELYEKLAEKEPGLGVLYMSGYTSQALSIRGGVYSEHNYIQKPFSVKELSRKVGLLVAEKCSHKL